MLTFVQGDPNAAISIVEPVIMRPMFAVSVHFEDTISSTYWGLSIDVRPSHIDHIRIKGVRRNRDNRDLQPPKACRSGEELSQDRQERHEIQRRDAEDES